MADSVSSISRRRGERPASAGMVRIRSPSVRSLSCDGDTLNASVSLSGHWLASRAAKRSRCSVNSFMRPAALRNRYETVGSNPPERRVLPARQRFEADDLLGGQIDQRLIMRPHVTIADGAPQVALDAIALLGARIYFGVEKAGSRLRLFVFGAVKRDVRPAQNLDVTWSVLRKQRDADTDPEVMLKSACGNRLVDLFDHA